MPPTPTRLVTAEMSLSVIVPALNEAALIGRSVRDALDGGACEVIVADGGSTDGTATEARRHGAIVVDAPRGRGPQLAAGVARAGGQTLLLVHADTRLPAAYRDHVAQVLTAPGVVAGAFRLRIDAPGRGLRLVEQAVAWRSGRLGLPYGDQAIFLRAETLARAGGVPELPAMEDFELVRRLRRLGRIAIADAAVTTSARRWRARGVWRTTALNQLCIAAYLAGVPSRRIASWRAGRDGRRGQSPSVAMTSPNGSDSNVTKTMPTRS